MRVLSDNELELVSGGQSASTAPLQPTVRVNATIGANQYVPFSLNQDNFGYTTGGTSECINCNPGGSARKLYPAANGLPSAARMECLINATGEYQMGWDPGFQLIGLGAYAAVGPADISDTFIAQNQSSIPTSYNNNLNGQTQRNSNYSATTITASANTPWSGPVRLIDPAGNISTVQVSLSAEQHLLKTVGHETAHQHGVGNNHTADDEARADWYGMQAVNRYNATTTWKNCPSQ